jgi:hypothetical protein
LRPGKWAYGEKRERLLKKEIKRSETDEKRGKYRKKDKTSRVHPGSQKAV